MYPLYTDFLACFKILSTISLDPEIISMSVPPFTIIAYPYSSVTLKKVLGKNSLSDLAI